MENGEIEILLVEDNMKDAELAIHSLKKHKLTNKMIHLKDGAEALDFIFCTGQFADRDKNSKPKVILLDLKMPKVGGIDVLKKIKENESTKNIPVVVLTSSKEDPDVRTCYELGVNSYIVKPVDFDNFQKAVLNLGLYWLLLNHTTR